MADRTSNAFLRSKPVRLQFFSGLLAATRAAMPGAEECGNEAGQRKTEDALISIEAV